MKETLVILLTALLLANCAGKETNTEVPVIEALTHEVQNDDDTKEKAAPLMIGGKQYRGRLGGWVIAERGSWRTDGDPVDCTVEDIDKLIVVGIRVNPEDPESRNSLENLELLQNVKDLYIGGENLDKVDFSPVSSLVNLEKLEIEGNIARLPDLSNLERLRTVEIKDAALVSLEGLGGGVEDLDIRMSPAAASIVLKAGDMNSMDRLKNFSFWWGKIDMGGIERFTSMEQLVICYCEPVNLNGIGGLKNLRYTAINIISPDPSIEFLRDMPNLGVVHLYGNFHLYNYYYPFSSDYEAHPTQMLDVSPLATSYEPIYILCQNFIIKNISSLDVRDDIYPYFNLLGSRLYDETEKSKHGLYLELVSER